METAAAPNLNICFLLTCVGLGSLALCAAIPDQLALAAVVLLRESFGVSDSQGLLPPAMGLLSILPASFAVVETWATRLFLFLGLIIIGPWAALLLYDLLLYVFRAAAYEIPVVGGRARGKARPRAPSLTERPSGHRRRFSLARRSDGPVSNTSSSRTDPSDARFRNISEEKEDESSST